jgi:uncharacterized protein (TIGR04255 family)
MHDRVQRFELERAPLVYAVAQAKFSTVENIAKSIPEFQEKLRMNGYPRMIAGQLTNITFSPQSQLPDTFQTPRWDFHDRERHVGIVLAKDAISLQVAKYSGFEGFCSRFKSALETLNEIVAPALIERLGLRYVNLIRPDAGRSVHEYVQEGLLGIRDERAGVIKSSCFVNYSGVTAAGILSVRSLQRTDGQILPPDLHPMTLSQSVAPVPVGEKILTLDFDHYSDLQQSPIEFSPIEVIQRMWHLHDNITMAFLAATTSVALDEWGLRQSLAEWARGDQ